MVCCALPSSRQTAAPSPHLQGQHPSLASVGGGTGVQWLELELELDWLELELLERLELELELERLELELELERLELELD